MRCRYWNIRTKPWDEYNLRTNRKVVDASWSSEEYRDR
jgi:hypothetical protein